jgi:hypothetical protein
LSDHLGPETLSNPLDVLGHRVLPPLLPFHPQYVAGRSGPLTPLRCVRGSDFVALGMHSFRAAHAASLRAQEAVHGAQCWGALGRLLRRAACAALRASAAC